MTPEEQFQKDLDAKLAAFLNDWDPDEVAQGHTLADMKREIGEMLSIAKDIGFVRGLDAAAGY